MFPADIFCMFLVSLTIMLLFGRSFSSDNINKLNLVPKMEIEKSEDHSVSTSENTPTQSGLSSSINMIRFIIRLKRQFDLDNTEQHSPLRTNAFFNALINRLAFNDEPHVIFSQVDMRYYDFPDYNFFEECFKNNTLRFLEINSEFKIRRVINFFLALRDIIDHVSINIFENYIKPEQYPDFFILIEKILVCTRRILVSRKSSFNNLEIIKTLNTKDFNLLPNIELYYSFKLIQNIFLDFPTQYHEDLRDSIYSTGAPLYYDFEMNGRISLIMKRRMKCSYYISSHITAIIMEAMKDYIDYRLNSETIDALIKNKQETKQ